MRGCLYPDYLVKTAAPLKLFTYTSTHNYQKENDIQSTTPCAGASFPTTVKLYGFSIALMEVGSLYMEKGCKHRVSIRETRQIFADCVYIITFHQPANYCAAVWQCGAELGI